MRPIGKPARMKISMGLFLLFLVTVPVQAQSLEGNWTIVRMVEDGKVRELFPRGTPWLELKQGLWSLYMSGRIAGSGAYSMAGPKLTMKYDDGSSYGQFNVRNADPDLTLTGVGEFKGFDLGCKRMPP